MEVDHCGTCPDWANSLNAQDATRASFTEYYNVPGRTIVAVSNYGPKYRLTEEPPSLSEGRPPKKERMPELYAWSDIVWLLWADRAERLGQPPRCVFVSGFLVFGSWHPS